MTAKLIELMDKVFNEDGSVKPCGREVCKKLITCATDFSEAKHAANHTESTHSLKSLQASEKYVSPNYGNPDTGYMNIENLLALRAELKQ